MKPASNWRHSPAGRKPGSLLVLAVVVAALLGGCASRPEGLLVPVEAPAALAAAIRGFCDG